MINLRLRKLARIRRQIRAHEIAEATGLSLSEAFDWATREPADDRYQLKMLPGGYFQIVEVPVIPEPVLQDAASIYALVKRKRRYLSELIEGHPHVIPALNVLSAHGLIVRTLQGDSLIVESVS